MLWFHVQIEDLGHAGVCALGGFGHGSAFSTVWYSWVWIRLWVLLHPAGLGRDPLATVVMPRLTGMDVWVMRDNNTAVINYAGSHYLVSKSFVRRCGAIIRPLYGCPTNRLRKSTDHGNHRSFDPVHPAASMVRLGTDRLPSYLRIVILWSPGIHGLYCLAMASVKEIALLHNHSMVCRSLLRDRQRSQNYLVRSRQVSGLPLAFAGCSVAMHVRLLDGSVQLDVLRLYPHGSLEIGVPGYGTWTGLEFLGTYYGDNPASDYGPRGWLPLAVD